MVYSAADDTGRITSCTYFCANGAGTGSSTHYDGIVGTNPEDCISTRDCISLPYTCCC
ncbi:unnamed protein product, partial [Rotaria sordida]